MNEAKQLKIVYLWNKRAFDEFNNIQVDNASYILSIFFKVTVSTYINKGGVTWQTMAQQPGTLLHAF